MHDEGSAFEGIGGKYGMADINCTKHIAANGDKASGGLMELHKEFQYGFNRVLYSSYFENDDSLVKFLSDLQEKCKIINHNKSYNFLENLKRNRF